MNSDIAVVILELSKAIREDNLELTQEKVLILNNNLDKIVDGIDDLITAGDYGNISLDNQSFNYVLDNALFLTFKDLYKFRRKVRKLLLQRDEELIKNFILEIINEDSSKYKEMETFYEDLILLTSQINDEEIFNTVKIFLESQVN